MEFSTLYELLHHCSVRLSLPNGTSGTGFFVAPGYLLTCEHVVRDAGELPIKVRWQQEYNFAEAHVEQLFSEYDVALLRFELPQKDLPCVYLDEDLGVGDKLYLFGYPDTDYENGRPVTPECEGFTGDSPPFIMLKHGQLQPGMSGAALLNRRTGKVCGMAKFTRDKFTDLGGGGIKASVILAQFPQLSELQWRFHQQDKRWQKFLTQLKISSNSKPSSPNNLPRSGVVNFVGRENELTLLHDQLQHSEQRNIIAIEGMGGIGKTELALRYARYSLEKQSYIAGICWLQAKQQDIGIDLVNFTQAQLGLMPPDGLDLLTQVQFCWRNWPKNGDVLVIIDDVTDYDAIQPYLPPDEHRFKVLFTTRLQLGVTIRSFPINVLSLEASLKLLSSLISSEKLETELETAQSLCDWLGYLPLGLELVGRFLARKPDWSLGKMQQKLESKRLESRALNKRQSDMTAIHESVAAAFDLSWQELDESEQQLAYHLSLFAVAPIPWGLITEWIDKDEDDLEDWRDEGLVNRSLLKRVGYNTYQLHQLIREFFRTKLNKGLKFSNLKQSFCQNMVEIAHTVPESPTLEQILAIEPNIPHLAEAATTWLSSMNSESVVKLFVGLGKFYEGQGLYPQAETWYDNCYHTIDQKLGENSLIFASVQIHLARIYQFQGKYVESEELYKQVLEIQKSNLQDSATEIAETLNDLGALLYKQGNYSDDAESLFFQTM